MSSLRTCPHKKESRVVLSGTKLRKALSEGEEVSGKCLDLSSGGMFVESQADLPPGTEIELSFKLPDGPGTQLNCRAVVSWLNRKPNPLKPHYPHGLGIMFAKLPEAVHKAILRISDKKTSS